MLLNADVISGEVRETTFFDQGTGAPKPQWVVNMTVLDVDTDEKYDVQITEGFPLLEELKERKRQGEHVDVLRDLASQLEAQLPPRHTPMQLQVLKLRGKQVAFLKLVCRVVAVGATV
ncbi:MAG TPA: hypothetical protein VKV29_09600 [Chthonomonas sp.]|uniref:hypothetical protein n=1 Tax=Chthonomonas sp. TaxID=2282153 RepID=UPI002B4B5457|nr:hypothetical protein [Chthonomonas sp.]HLG77068.1 hypothetical protein [Ktedonobacteraceae bacterium]HLH80521.1 hypothetical protein [Chthonomonas sp.]